MSMPNSRIFRTICSFKLKNIVLIMKTKSITIQEKIMNKKDILMYNQKNPSKDEREIFIESQIFSKANMGILLTLILIFFFKVLKGYEYEDLVAIFWGYLATIHYYKYQYVPNRKTFLTSIITIILFILFLTMYFIKMW